MKTIDAESIPKAAALIKCHPSLVYAIARSEAGVEMSKRDETRINVFGLMEVKDGVFQTITFNSPDSCAQTLAVTLLSDRTGYDQKYKNIQIAGLSMRNFDPTDERWLDQLAVFAYNFANCGYDDSSYPSLEAKFVKKFTIFRDAVIEWMKVKEPGANFSLAHRLSKDEAWVFASSTKSRNPLSHQSLNTGKEIITNNNLNAVNMRPLKKDSDAPAINKLYNAKGYDFIGSLVNKQLENVVCTSGFGPRQGHFHYGADYAVSASSSPDIALFEVFALGDAEIINIVKAVKLPYNPPGTSAAVASTIGGGFGNHIEYEMVLGNAKIVVRCAHLAWTPEFDALQTGTSLKAGQLISKAGATGSVWPNDHRGVHLHIDFRTARQEFAGGARNLGLFIDPASFSNQKSLFDVASIFSNIPTESVYADNFSLDSDDIAGLHIANQRSHSETSTLPMFNHNLI